ncbi:zinc ribbon domain-containing protein [Natronolimnobius sp. AArcel1]|uniref:zinc ribbon domain-containing protein n=1 Tax=Natronolimnobius sp. AArcel1 TaxID=1679093 RepID=UPI0013EB02C5|nr:zinc ribbon domain-containing protein [Natronolimnobius sp. AArcel1]NGM69153.1 zinc ribbon domain-containing protein [Natronolimnobius sp. AArcel1]
MINLESVGLAARVLIALGVMIGPTLLFLGLYRALEWLRDDRLLEEVARREGRTDVNSLAPTFGGFVAGATGSKSRSSLIRCGHCGAPTLADSPCLECGKSP